MWCYDELFPKLEDVSTVNVLLTIISASLVWLAVNHLWTTSTANGEPNFVPTLLPYIGHAISFGADAESFLQNCVNKFGSVFTLLLAGERLSIVADPFDFGPAVFRNSKLHFDPIADNVSENAFGVSFLRLGLDQGWVDKSYRRHLQGKGLVPLTSGFLEHMPGAIQAAAAACSPGPVTTTGSEWQTVPLYPFVLESVFRASSAALFGPSAASSALCAAFSRFDDAFPLLVAGLPPWVLPGVTAARATLRQQFTEPDPGQHAMMRERDTKLAETAEADSKRGGSGGGAGAQAREAMQSEMLWAAEANTVPAAFWAVARLLNDRRPGGAQALVRQEGLEALGRALLREKERAREAAIRKGGSTAAASSESKGSSCESSLPGWVPSDESSLPEWVPSDAGELLSLLRPADMDGLAVLDSVITEVLRTTTASLTVRLALKDVSLELGKGRRDAVLAALRARGLEAEDAAEGELPAVRRVKIRKGDRVAVFPPLLHRDAAVFPDPHLFRFDRHADPKAVDAVRSRVEADGPMSSLVLEAVRARPVRAVERKQVLRVRLRPRDGEGGAGAGEVLEVPMPRVGGDSVVMPFGGGRSKCPGRMFARNEIRLTALALVLLAEAKLQTGRKAGGTGGDWAVDPSPSKGQWPKLLKSRAGLGILPPSDRQTLWVSVRRRSAQELATMALEAVGEVFAER